MLTLPSHPMRLLCLLMLMVCVTLLTACNNEKTDTKEIAKKPTIALLLYDDKDLYVNLVRKSIEKNIGDKATLIVKSANTDQLLQNEQVDACINAKVDGIMLNIVEPTNATYIIEKTVEANIPLVFFNREPDVNTFKAYDDISFVGTLAKDAGILQGDIIKQLWDEKKYDKNKDGKFQYLMIQASLDNIESVARTEYSIQQASKEHGISLQQIGDTLMCGWNEYFANQDVQQVWPVLGEDVEFIIANNDAMALGAIAALQQFGYNTGKKNAPFIPVIGVDAISEAIDAIRQGTMSATVKQDGFLMGKAIVQLILNVIEEKPFLDGTTWQWDESGKAIRIPYTLLTLEEATANKQ